MNCQEIQKLMPIYMDEELKPQENQQVMEHVAECVACQKELKALEDSWAMLGELKGIEPEPGYIGKFWTRLSLEQSWQEKVIEGIQNSFFKKRLVPVLVAACMVVFVGSFVLNNYVQIRQTDQALASLSQEDLEMVENIELVENFELIAEIEFFEDLDIIESLNGFES